MELYEDVLSIKFNENNININQLPKIKAIKKQIEKESKRGINKMSYAQSKLIEPFTTLYFEKELLSRNLVKSLGKSAFLLPEYKDIIDRLNHGYSFSELVDVLEEYPELDKNTTVSIFIDESLDAGVIVPIIATKIIDNIRVYYRAYRHGEDVPFGEHQEKLCAILLQNYFKYGDEKILTKLRVEKLLVLFLRIGELEGLFKLTPNNTIYYHVNVDAYIYGNVPTIERVKSNPTRNVRYIKYKNEVAWLSDMLCEKNIIKTDGNDKYVGICDNINISIDNSTKSKVSAIGRTFATLYLNWKKGVEPSINDRDLVLLTTCLYPIDILNALAAELAIFKERWFDSKEIVLASNDSNKEEVYNNLAKGGLYRCINSGQAKYYDFIEKKAINKIREIDEKLSRNSELSLYQLFWSQFWPTNYEWSESSIDQNLLKTIHIEGVLLVELNIIVRILFIFLTTDQCNKERLYKQILEHQDKLKNFIYGNSNEVISFIDMSNRIILHNNNDIQLVYGILEKMIRRINATLIDVELLVNKHGKINKIVKYNYAVEFKSKEGKDGSQICNIFEDILISKRIVYKKIAILHSTDFLEENGTFFFLSGNSSFYDAKMAIKRTIDQKNEEINLQLDSIKVFCNLSEELKLKLTNEASTGINLSLFSEYLKRINANLSNVNRSNNFCNVYWILQENKKSISLYNNINAKLLPEYNVIDNKTINYETLTSDRSLIINSYYIKTKFVLNKYREEYKNTDKKCKIFISYTNDTDENMYKVNTIVERLKNENFSVQYYEDILLGSDMIKFMRQIENSDLTLIMGTVKYKNRAENVDDSGVSFEDRLIAGTFMSENRNKIVPIALEKFNDSIPKPFNTLKGMSFEKITEEKLDKLVSGIIKRFQANN